jgi:hypothetical protein
MFTQMFVTEHESQQFREIELRLRRLNRAALGKLRRIRPSISDRQCRDVGTWLGLATMQMNSIVRLREEHIIKIVGRPSIVHVIIVKCTCPKSDPLVEASRQQHEEQSLSLLDVLKVDPMWLQEIDNVLEFGHRVEERGLQRRFTRGTAPRRFLSGLQGLVRALLRQQRSLLKDLPEPPEDEIEIEPICPVCHPEYQSTMKEGQNLKSSDHGELW